MRALALTAVCSTLLLVAACQVVRTQPRTDATPAPVTYSATEAGVTPTALRSEEPPLAIDGPPEAAAAAPIEEPAPSPEPELRPPSPTATPPPVSEPRPRPGAAPTQAASVVACDAIAASSQRSAQERVWSRDQCAAETSRVPGGGVPVTVVRTVTWELSLLPGRTSDEITAAIAAHPVYVDAAGAYEAATFASLGYQYATSGSSPCLLQSITVSLKVRAVVPGLASYSEVELPLRRQWDAYQLGLMKHEQGHVQRNLDAAGELASSLRSIARGQTCALLQARLEDVARGVNQRLQERQRAYDDTFRRNPALRPRFPGTTRD